MMVDETLTPGGDEYEPREGEARRDESAPGQGRLEDLDVSDSDGGAIKGGNPKLPATK